MTRFLTRPLLILTVLVGVNILSAFLFVRLDLTADRRYTLTEATRSLLADLPEPVQVNVYLTGTLPPAFARLETAIRETLDEMQTASGQRLTYRFIDPLAEPNAEAKKKAIDRLMARGLMPTNLAANQGGMRTEQLFFPAAIFSQKGKETPVLLLKGNKAATPDEQLNQSYEGVEYELATAIRQLTTSQRRRVGLISGNTVVAPERFSDLLANVQQRYDLFLVDLTKPGPITGVDAVLVPKPDRPFSDDAVFRLDQFVVNGGRAMFFVDGQRVDSVSAEGTFAQPLDLGLNDLFFGWGVRVNRNIVKDLRCSVIPLNVGTMGDKPNIQLVPWRFYPVVNSFGNSPITRNLDAVWCRFASTLDTVRADGGDGQPILKTPLLLTSPYTKVLQAPAVVAYNEARQQPDPRTYDGGVRLLGCLLEGRFRSIYANRILPGDPRSAGFRAVGEPSRVIVVSDGDFVVNDMDYKRGQPLPLGYDRFTRQTFANKDFALNALDYLIDPNGVIAARSKQIALRPLDKIRLGSERTTWQLLNLLGPLALVALLGGLWHLARRQRYGRA
jgi:ABC-2 type transport system permease protein